MSPLFSAGKYVFAPVNHTLMIGSIEIYSVSISASTVLVILLKTCGISSISVALPLRTNYWDFIINKLKFVEYRKWKNNYLK